MYTLLNLPICGIKWSQRLLMKGVGFGPSVFSEPAALSVEGVGNSSETLEGH